MKSNEKKPNHVPFNEGVSIKRNTVPISQPKETPIEKGVPVTSQEVTPKPKPTDSNKK